MPDTRHPAPRRCRPRRFDKRDDFLTPALIRQTDNGNRIDQRVLGKHIFHLLRVNILAAGNDHVIGPAAQEQRTVRIAIAKITSIIPSIADRPRVGIGTPPVARKGLGALHRGNDLTDFPSGQDFFRAG